MQLGICHFSRLGGVESGYHDCGKTWSMFLSSTSFRQWTHLPGPNFLAMRGAYPIRMAVDEHTRPTSPHPSRAPLLPPESLVLPRKRARGDAHDLLRVGDGGADRLRHAAVSFEDRKRALGGGRVDHVAEADAHVEDLVHLAVVDARVALDEGKDGMRLNQPVDLVADRGGDAGEVEQAVAGDVDQRLHPGNRREDLHRLGNVDVGRAQELFHERARKLVELVADGMDVALEERLALVREAVDVDEGDLEE